MRPFDYTRAADPAGAVALAARPYAKYLAGGTNLVDLMREAGFETVSYRTFAGGIVALHTGART